MNSISFLNTEFDVGPAPRMQFNLPSRSWFLVPAEIEFDPQAVIEF